MQSVNRDIMHLEVYFCTCCISWIIWTASGLQVNGITLAPIYWNSSNPMFKISNNGHIIEVNLYDEIDFVCPYFSMTSDNSSYEYYIIHQVTKEAYEDCDLHADNGAVMIVNCSNPNHRKRFTMLIETFQAIPKVPEFNAGHTYYYISTSSGSKDGLLNIYGGACLHHNMKMLVKVCCDDAMTKSTNILTQALSSTTTNQIGQRSFEFRPSVYPEIKPVTHRTFLKDGHHVDKTNGEHLSEKIQKTSTLQENNIYLAHKGLRNNVHLMLPLPIVVLSTQLFAFPMVVHIVLSTR